MKLCEDYRSKIRNFEGEITECKNEISNKNIMKKEYDKVIALYKESMK